MVVSTLGSRTISLPTLKAFASNRASSRTPLALILLVALLPTVETTLGMKLANAFGLWNQRWSEALKARVWEVFALRKPSHCEWSAL
jgi:hypothetical protein